MLSFNGVAGAPAGIATARASGGSALLAPAVQWMPRWRVNEGLFGQDRGAFVRPRLLELRYQLLKQLEARPGAKVLSMEMEIVESVQRRRLVIRQELGVVPVFVDLLPAGDADRGTVPHPSIPLLASAKSLLTKRVCLEALSVE
ncbi:hypothetical protein ACLESD_10080 [Pyxidicoccus sp. 3LFB2]